MPEIKWCHECGFGIYPEKDAVTFHDKTFHADCLLRIAPKLNISKELADMGLDQPPRPAA